jgi:hypothetical protein
MLIRPIRTSSYQQISLIETELRLICWHYTPETQRVASVLIDLLLLDDDGVVLFG